MTTRRRATRNRIVFNSLRRWAKLSGQWAMWRFQGLTPVSCSHPRKHNPLVTIVPGLWR